MKAGSLRTRLIFIILVPLLLISLLVGLWQYQTTTARAENIFDRGLLSAALAISRDIAVSDGDALSPATRALVNDTSGGELFYHVYAPDGVFVTGYSTPPVLPRAVPTDQAEPFYFNARYQSADVRVLRFQDVTSVGDVSGVFNITVWQSAQVRGLFVREVVSRSFAIIGLLVMSVALVVWFGVRLGLRPLLNLEEAIAQRTSTDLDPIRRAVPEEVAGIVTTLNRLLDQVTRRISSKDEFISNAAHQLRNPVAGVLALAEAVESAPTAEAAKKRSAELVHAAREASALTDKLLSFERASGSDIARTGERLDLCQLLQNVVDGAARQLRDGIRLTTSLPTAPVFVHGDAVMLREAVLNMISNAQIHGGPTLSEITVSLAASAALAEITVQDNGRGIPTSQHLEAISRFGQAGGGPGSGLGLAIAAKVMQNHAGRLEIAAPSQGALIKMYLPTDVS